SRLAIYCAVQTRLIWRVASQFIALRTRFDPCARAVEWSPGAIMDFNQLITGIGERILPGIPAMKKEKSIIARLRTKEGSRYNLSRFITVPLRPTRPSQGLYLCLGWLSN